MRYVAKPRNKKIYILLIVVILVFLGWLLFKNLNKDEVVEKGVKLCNMSIEESNDFISKKHKDYYEVNEYLFYGESLTLLKDKYDSLNSDELIGKTVILKNICNDEEYTFLLETYLDRQISFNDLSDGIYEVYINDMSDLTTKRLVSNDVFEDSITTISRDNKVKHVKLYSNKDKYKDSNGVNFDKNYIFIEVKSKKANDKDYDIMLDPYGNDTDFTYTPNLGVGGKSVIEAKETYDLALKLKEKLEKSGLRVGITRKDSNEVLDTYGEDGRLDRAYKSNARYYVQLTFSESVNDDIYGLDILHSSYSSDALASSIYKVFKDNELQYYVDNTSIKKCNRVIGMDKKAIYDSSMVIREIGGYATHAAKYSENSSTNTFALNNKHGLNAISISFAYLDNSSDENSYKSNRDMLIDDIANGIINRLRVN